jgi:hypothetical protein
MLIQMWYICSLDNYSTIGIFHQIAYGLDCNRRELDACCKAKNSPCHDIITWMKICTWGKYTWSLVGTKKWYKSLEMQSIVLEPFLCWVGSFYYRSFACLAGHLVGIGWDVLVMYMFLHVTSVTDKFVNDEIEFFKGSMLEFYTSNGNELYSNISTKIIKNKMRPISF